MAPLQPPLPLEWRQHPLLARKEAGQRNTLPRSQEEGPHGPHLPPHLPLHLGPHHPHPLSSHVRRMIAHPTPARPALGARLMWDLLWEQVPQPVQLEMRVTPLSSHHHPHHPPPPPPPLMLPFPPPHTSLPCPPPPPPSRPSGTMCQNMGVLGTRGPHLGMSWTWGSSCPAAPQLPGANCCTSCRRASWTASLQLPSQAPQSLMRRHLGRQWSWPECTQLWLPTWLGAPQKTCLPPSQWERLLGRDS